MCTCHTLLYTYKKTYTWHLKQGSGFAFVQDQRNKINKFPSQAADGLSQEAEGTNYPTLSAYCRSQSSQQLSSLGSEGFQMVLVVSIALRVKRAYCRFWNDPVAAQLCVNAINLIYSYFTCMERGQSKNFFLLIKLIPCWGTKLLLCSVW